jgi:hypothetical protein
MKTIKTNKMKLFGFVIMACIISMGIIMGGCSKNDYDIADRDISLEKDALIEKMGLVEMSNEKFEFLKFDTDKELLDFLKLMDQRRTQGDKGSFKVNENKVHNTGDMEIFEISPIISSDHIRLKSGSEPNSSYYHISAPGGIFSTQHLYWQVQYNPSNDKYSMVDNSVSYAISGLTIGWTASINHVDYLQNPNNHVVSFRIVYEYLLGVSLGGTKIGATTIWVYTYRYDCVNKVFSYTGYEQR